MNQRSQRGMTLVELLVAMAVTSIVMLGISSVVLVGYQAASLWSQQVTEAQTLNQLAGWLDQDVHRYAPCHTQTSLQELDLCLPSQTAPNVQAVTYTTTAGPCPCNVIRSEVTLNSHTIVARGLVAQPVFQPECRVASNVDVGDIRVIGLAYPPGSQGPPPTAPPNLVVYFRAPLGSC